MAPIGAEHTQRPGVQGADQVRNLASRTFAAQSSHPNKLHPPHGDRPSMQKDKKGSSYGSHRSSQEFDGFYETPEFMLWCYKVLPYGCMCRGEFSRMFWASQSSITHFAVNGNPPTRVLAHCTCSTNGLSALKLNCRDTIYCVLSIPAYAGIVSADASADAGRSSPACHMICTQSRPLCMGTRYKDFLASSTYRTHHFGAASHIDPASHHPAVLISHHPL